MVILHYSLLMNKTLIYLLLLANLCAGTAFAWDTHPEAMLGHDSAAINMMLDEDHSHPDGDLHHEDHCCHGAAHLVGVIFTQTTQFVADSDTDFFALSQPPRFLYIAPLLRPPIV